CRKSPTIAGTADLRNRPSAGAPSTTASSPRDCATAAASPPRRSTASAASRRPTGPRLRVPPSSSARASRAPPPHHRLRRRLPANAIPSATSASSTTGRSTCCSSIPAAKNGWSRAASRLSSPMCIRARRRCAHPPPASATAPCGVGDGTVLVRVLRAMHDRFPHTPFYAVGKEISLEDVRLALQKMSDRFFEHPATVLVLTNFAYADAPWLAVKSLSAASSMVWHEVPLSGDSAYRFEQQITDL